MSNSAVVEAVVSRHASPTSHDLLVLWQARRGDPIVPVGRLRHEDDNYLFNYVAAVKAIKDFRHLPGLPQDGSEYRSHTLPAIFEQRVMSRARADFSAYSDSLGLRPSEVTPWEQLVRSGGIRAGDLLQIMETPSVEHGCARARFFLNGVRYVPGRTFNIDGVRRTSSAEEHERALMLLERGSSLTVHREDNEQDPDALIVASGGIALGYIPAVLSSAVRALLEANKDLVLTTVRRNGPQHSPHLRAVVELNAPAPQGFSFDPDGNWEPLVQ